MPIYEYACEKCESEFEVEQRITDDPIKSCPRCQSRKIKRLISRTSFVLKGGGWYSDLYSSSGAKNDKAGAADTSDAKGKSASADSKPPTPSESKTADAPAAKTKSPDKAKSKSGKSGA